MGISDHVVVLDAGVRIASGTPAEVQRDPAVRKAYLGEVQQRIAAPRRAAGAPLLEIGRLAAGYGAEPVLKEIDLRVANGEMVAVLGANGAGKSTLLSIAATLLDPSDGQVLYGDRTAADGGTALRGRIGVLGHDLYIYPELTAAENLAFFGRLYGVGNIDRAVAAALDKAVLADRANDPVASFSRGMRQRLALERALIHSPRLLLLDEPFTGLDDASTVALRQRLATARDEGGIVLVTTHDLDAIEALVDDAHVLVRGRMERLPAGAGSLRDRYRRHVIS
jgi:heme exporter protein A